MRIAKARIWMVNGTEYTSKNKAYRVCRTLNGKKAGGRRPFKVERKNA